MKLFPLAVLAFGLFLTACAQSTYADLPSSKSSTLPPPVEGETASLPLSGESEICGGIAGFQCGDERLYCAMETKMCVEVADAAGTCKVKPEICTMDYAPVCGCDGKTYGNACSAAGNGVSIASLGECEGQ